MGGDWGDRCGASAWNYRVLEPIDNLAPIGAVFGAMLFLMQRVNRERRRKAQVMHKPRERYDDIV